MSSKKGPITRKQVFENPDLKEIVDNYNPYQGGSLLQHTPPRSLLPPSIDLNKERAEIESTSQDHSINLLDLNSSIETIRPSQSINNSTIIHVQDHNMATANVPLKDALVVVPDFNGKNIPLSDFIEGCLEAKEMVGRDQEKNLLRLIKSRLQGEARQTVRSEKVESFDDLINLLKTIYSSHSTVHELIARLGNELQYDDESVISFANRIRDLAKKILEMKKLNNPEVTEEFKTFINENIAQCFKRGLKPDIEQRLKENNAIAEIIKDALQIERQLESSRKLRNSRTRPPKKYTMPCQICHQGSHKTEECTTKKCTYCKQPGHLEEYCFKKLKGQNSEKTCQLCGKLGHAAPQCYKFPKCQICNKMGHIAAQCRTLPLSNPTEECQIYSRAGHTAKDCFKFKQGLNNGNKPILTCQLCQQPGHAASTCRQNRSTTHSTPTCNYCKNKGHTIEDCRKRKYNNQQKNDQRLQESRAAEETTPLAQTRSLNSANLLAELMPM